MMGATPEPRSFVDSNPNDTAYVNSVDSPGPEHRESDIYVASSTHDKLDVGLVNAEVGTPSQPISVDTAELNSSRFRCSVSFSSSTPDIIVAVSDSQTAAPATNSI